MPQGDDADKRKKYLRMPPPPSADWDEVPTNPAGQTPFRSGSDAGRSSLPVRRPRPAPSQQPAASVARTEPQPTPSPPPSATARPQGPPTGFIEAGMYGHPPKVGENPGRIPSPLSWPHPSISRALIAVTGISAFLLRTGTVEHVAVSTSNLTGRFGVIWSLPGVILTLLPLGLAAARYSRPDKDDAPLDLVLGVGLALVALVSCTLCLVAWASDAWNPTVATWATLVLLSTACAQGVHLLRGDYELSWMWHRPVFTWVFSLGLLGTVGASLLLANLVVSASQQHLMAWDAISQRISGGSTTCGLLEGPEPQWNRGLTALMFAPPDPELGSDLFACVKTSVRTTDLLTGRVDATPSNNFSGSLLGNADNQRVIQAWSLRNERIRSRVGALLPSLPAVVAERYQQELQAYALESGVCDGPFLAPTLSRLRGAGLVAPEACAATQWSRAEWMERALGSFQALAGSSAWSDRSVLDQAPLSQIVDEAYTVCTQQPPKCTDVAQAMLLDVGSLREPDRAVVFRLVGASELKWDEYALRGQSGNQLWVFTYGDLSEPAEFASAVRRAWPGLRNMKAVASDCRVKHRKAKGAYSFAADPDDGGGFVLVRHAVKSGGGNEPSIFEISYSKRSPCRAGSWR